VQAQAQGALLPPPLPVSLSRPPPPSHPPSQVQRVARALSSNGAPFRSFLMTGGEVDDKERAKKVRGGRRACPLPAGGCGGGP
jgi:hypothetical protein